MIAFLHKEIFLHKKKIFLHKRKIFILHKKKIKNGHQKSQRYQKTLFPTIVQGPLGCHLLSSRVPKSRFRGSEKSFFQDDKWHLKTCKIAPWVFSTHRFGLNPYLDLIYYSYSINYFNNYLGNKYFLEYIHTHLVASTLLRVENGAPR